MNKAGKNPLLSVVIPVYNGEKFMEGCLNSVAASFERLTEAERASLELIVCDNHSTDRTLEAAKSAQMGDSYRIVQTPEHFDNRTRNWHYGLSEAQGSWMMMLHADDRMASSGLSAILSACRLQESGPAAMISGRHRTFRDTTPPGGLKPNWPYPSLVSGEGLRTRVLPFKCPFVPFTVMRRAAYHLVGGLEARYELVQDWDLWIRLLAHGPLYYTPQEFGEWRAHEFSEKYAMVIAQETLDLIAGIRKLVPGLSQQNAQEAFEAQLPRVMTWLPNTPLEVFAGNPDVAAKIGSRPRPSQPSIQAAIKRTDRYVAVQLGRLRALGTLRPSRSGGTPSASSLVSPGGHAGKREA